MENQSPASSTNSSSPPKHDQKLKSVVVSEEQEVTMKPKSPQEVMSERTILEKPRFILETVRATSDDENYLCDVCEREFPSRRSLSAHQKFHRKEQELKRQRLLFGSNLSDDAYLGPSDSNEGLSFSRFRCGGGDSSSSIRPHLFSTGEGVKQMETTMFPPHALDRSLTGNPSYSPSQAFSNDEDHINLDLTLGPSKPTGGSSNSIKNNTNSYLDMEATRRTTNLFGPVCPRVPPFNFVAGNPYDSFPGRYVPLFGNTNPCHDLFSLQGNGMGSSHPKRLFSTGVPPFAPPYPTSTNLCHDLFSLQGNGMGSSHPKRLFSTGVPPFAPPYPTSTNLCHDLFSLKENGMGSSSHSRLLPSMETNKFKVPPNPTSTNLCNNLFPLQENGLAVQSKSLISKGKAKVMVPEDEDDDDDDEDEDDDDDADDVKDTELRWLTKKKRSRPA
ncbi:PREDICTED: uncharacterized protein LOC104761457 [Camelina sativa]|uniref:Uncharacterized protein LOC104761457 n=1 Tax=Camelina sativa TaxID=90675 RepID=A0ABM0X9X6_CAMSA|nr:PREDICTED: uncharacterized protein LOC104761457 [Camelina sativa]